MCILGAFLFLPNSSFGATARLLLDVALIVADVLEEVKPNFMDQVLATLRSGRAANGLA